MDLSGFIIFIFVLIHLIGIILFLLNAIYLHNTQGYGSARITKEKFDRDQWKLSAKRRCKIRNTLASNILVLYHTVLIVIEIGLGIVCEIQGTWSQHTEMDNLTGAFWVSALVNYCLLFFLLVPVVTCNAQSHGYIGQLYACNSFEFLNLIIFWALILFTLICAAPDLCDLPSPLPSFVLSWGTFTFVPVYVALVGCAFVYYDRNKPFKKIITRQEAINIINQKLEEAPSIKWTVISGHEDGEGGIAGSFDESGVHTFSSSRWKTSSSIPDPPEKLFQRKFTELNIHVWVKPEGKEGQREIISERERFSVNHCIDDVVISITTENHFKETYLVGPTDSMPGGYNLKFYIFLSLLGLSLPYRWFFYFSIEHINYKITKRVPGRTAGRY